MSDPLFMIIVMFISAAKTLVHFSIIEEVGEMLDEYRFAMFIPIFQSYWLNATTVTALDLAQHDFRDEIQHQQIQQYPVLDLALPAPIRLNFI